MGKGVRASYLELLEGGELAERVHSLYDMMRECHLCPRGCGVRRTDGERGKCRMKEGVVVSSFGPHFGEEAPLVGMGGSGTIFFSGCNLHCVFCQNHTISQLCHGEEVGKNKLARMMVSLQASGCRNLNLVSPTHFIPQILDALETAAGMGLSIPVVYNSGGYDSVEVLRLLDSIVDIYMPDMKYGDTKTEFSGVKDYPVVNREAVREMHRQVGDLQIDENGIAVRGLLVRHLVLPDDLAGSREVFDFISREISPRTYVNIMDQYRPCYRANEFPGLSRRITSDEYSKAVALARDAGLERLDSF